VTRWWQMLRVNEIFTSIQGEGYWTGLPVVFLRLQGCNLNCSWCDTKRALSPDGGKLWHVGDLLSSIRMREPATVVVTGGEPLLQAEGLYELISHECSQVDSYIHWHLETNGTLPLSTPKAFDWITVSPKPPDYMIHDSVWPHWDELKIVVDGPEAIEVAEMFAEREVNPVIQQPIILQPVSNDPEMIQLVVDYLTEKRDWRRRWRLGVQMHKYIGVE